MQWSLLMGDVFVTVLAYRKFFPNCAWRASICVGENCGGGRPRRQAKPWESPRLAPPLRQHAGPARRRSPYLSSKRVPATQSNSPAAVRFCPPLDDGPSAAGRVAGPPTDHGELPAGRIAVLAQLGVSPPALTTDQAPLAVLKFPPLTAAQSPLAVLNCPPLTDAKPPLIVLMKPTTNPPKLEKLCPSPTTTLCEPVRMSGPPISRGSL